MLAQELIARKRDGYELTDVELRPFLEAYGAGEVPDYQMSAFLMAVLLKGLSDAELARKGIARRDLFWLCFGSVASV